MGTRPPLKYASPKIFGGSNIKRKGAKASALKTSLEISLDLCERMRGSQGGRSWRPRLGKAKKALEKSGAPSKAPGMHHCHSVEFNSPSREEGGSWRKGRPREGFGGSGVSPTRRTPQSGRSFTV